MSKDPFQILADEITLIRSEIEKLQRTSLDKDEAKALHDIVAKSVNDLQKATPALERAIDQRLKIAVADMEEKATRAAQSAAKGAIRDTHTEVTKAAQKLLEDAQTIRNVAHRQFGSFWSWIALTAALCLFLGPLATMVLQGRADARQFARFTSLYCSTADGSKFTANNGKDYCAVPFN